MTAEKQPQPRQLPQNVLELPVRDSSPSPEEPPVDHLNRKQYGTAYEALNDARLALADVREAFSGALIVTSDEVLFRLRRAEQLVEACQVAWTRHVEGDQ